MGFWNWLFGSSGVDGSSVENAIVVGSVGEEYGWIKTNCPGFQPQMQALKSINGKSYDVFTLRNGNGEERTVYFDISQFYGKF